jgi:hypothetical protein
MARPLRAIGIVALVGAAAITWFAVFATGQNPVLAAKEVRGPIRVSGVNEPDEMLVEPFPAEQAQYRPGEDQARVQQAQWDPAKQRPYNPSAKEGQPGSFINTVDDLQKAIWAHHPEARNNPRRFDELMKIYLPRLHAANAERARKFQQERQIEADKRAQEKELRAEEAAKRKEEEEKPKYDQEDINMMAELFYQEGPKALAGMGYSKMTGAEKDAIRHAARVNHPDDPPANWPARWLGHEKTR